MSELLDTKKCFIQWFSLKKIRQTQIDPCASVNIHLIRLSNSICFFFYVYLQFSAIAIEFKANITLAI